MKAANVMTTEKTESQYAFFEVGSDQHVGILLLFSSLEIIFRVLRVVGEIQWENIGVSK